MHFQKFDKIPRLSRDIVITEKIDGTNAQVYIINQDDFILNFENPKECDEFIEKYALYIYPKDKDVLQKDTLMIFAGSRKKWLDTSSQGDNFGFAKWVQANGEELLKLGEGRHYGEWYGHGIQRNYGLEEKRFALFNVGKWIKQYNHIDGTKQLLNDKQSYCPSCCEIVPILYQGLFNTEVINKYLELLKENGSRIVLDFMNPEGIIIYHTASAHLYKKTILNDEKPKEQVNAEKKARS